MSLLILISIVCWIAPVVKGDCGCPPVIPHSTNNASTLTTRYHQNAVILYSCDDLYLPVGNPVFVCRNEGWSNSGSNFECAVRQCQFIEIQHGSVAIQSYSVGSIARFTCDPGYELHGFSAIICLSNSMWSGEVPTCEVVFCEELPEVDHLIRFQANEDGEFDDYNSFVTSRCEAGYQLVGDSTTVCQADGTWSGITARCERINCGPANIGEGIVDYWTDTYFGGIGRIECNPDYTLVGDETIYCDEGGWSGGYCYGNCTVGTIDNGHVETDTLREGERVRWNCDNGFAQYPENGESFCHNRSLVPRPECRPFEFGPSESGVTVTRWGTTRFTIISSEMSYVAAKSHCRNSYGGRLLTITNRSKMNYIASVLTYLNLEKDCSCLTCCWFSRVPKFWLGLFYSDTWRWPALAGARTTYTNWNSGEGGTTLGIKLQKCAAIHDGSSWQWEDVNCSNDNMVVCESNTDF